MKGLINLSLLALLFFPLRSYSQNEYFTNNPKWGISEPCQFSPFEPEWGTKTIYFVNGDTLLNEEVFVRIFQEGYTYNGTGTNSYSETPFYNPLPIAYLRSEGMKMFKWNQELGAKEMLYDFDVVVGGIFNTSVSSNPLNVSAIDTIMLGGVERRIITVSGWSQGNYESEYIEGVGHWRGIWHPNETQLDCQSYLTCFSLNDETYNVDTNVSPWLTPSAVSCEYVVSTDELPSLQFNVFPNPTSDELNIQCKSKIMNALISDPAGRVVYSIQPYKRDIEINTAFLATGIYFLSLKTDSGKIVTMKFIKD